MAAGRIGNVMLRGIIKKNVLQVSILFVCLGLFFGCGLKGPPVPPQKEPLPAVTDLRKSISANDLKLIWILPQGKKDLWSDVNGFRVYRNRSPVSGSDCKGCPVVFARIAEIPIDRSRWRHNKKFEMSYTEKLEKGFRYIYKVTIYRGDGRVGRDSNPVEFVY